LISYSYFLAGKKRKKAGNFPAFFCEPSGYFWKIFWTIVILKTDLEAVTIIDTMKIRTIRKNEKEFIETMINAQSPSIREGLFTVTKN